MPSAKSSFTPPTSSLWLYIWYRFFSFVFISAGRQNWEYSQIKIFPIWHFLLFQWEGLNSSPNQVKLEQIKWWSSPTYKEKKILIVWKDLILGPLVCTQIKRHCFLEDYKELAMKNFTTWSVFWPHIKLYMPTECKALNGWNGRQNFPFFRNGLIKTRHFQGVVLCSCFPAQCSNTRQQQKT